MSSWFCEIQSEASKSCYLVDSLVKLDGAIQVVEIFDTEKFGKILTIDGYIMQIEAFEFCYHEMIAHVPLFFHSNPVDILIIGGGDGGTSRECLKHSSVKSITLCEIDENVIKISSEYLPGIAATFKDHRHKIEIKDAHLFLKNTQETFDIVLVDVGDPIGVAETIYTSEFYLSLKKRLRKGGIVCTIGSSPFGEAELVKNIHRNLASIFSFSNIYVSSVPMYQFGLWTFNIASDDPFVFQEKKYKKESQKMKLRYYNEKIHYAAFCLPNFMKNW